MPVHIDPENASNPPIIELGEGDIALGVSCKAGAGWGALSIDALIMPAAVGEKLNRDTPRASAFVLWFNSVQSLDNMIHMLESIRPAFTVADSGVPQ